MCSAAGIMVDYSLLILTISVASIVFCYIGCVPASIKGFWFCSKPFKPGAGVVVCDSPKKYRVPDVSFESAPSAIPPGQIFAFRGKISFILLVEFGRKHISASFYRFNFGS